MVVDDVILVHGNSLSEDMKLCSVVECKPTPYRQSSPAPSVGLQNAAVGITFMSTSSYSDTAISVGKVVTALICKQNSLPLDTSPLLMLLRPLLTSLAVPRGQYWSHTGTAVTESCCPQTAADGIGGHWTTWAKHLVNGVSCWHHPIPKVSNPDVPVLGCGCHPQTVADGIGGHWTTWAMHLVNGVSCWHHPIPKVSNPDVPVLGCGCHPRAAGVWSIVHGSSDLVTLGKSCDYRKMAS